MVDLHTHILPHVDDGAKSLEEALAMADALTHQDIDTIVATPHFDAKKIALRQFLIQRDDAINELLSNGLIVLPGSETLLQEELITFSDISALCLADTRYLLLELPFLRKWDNLLYEYIKRLMQRHDLNPLVAHIERYPAINQRRIRKLRNIGCLLQMNADSIISKKSRRRCIRYIRKGYIDVLASDCHNMTDRAPRIGVACRILEQKLGTKVLLKLLQNGERIIKGERISEITDYYVLPK